MTRSPIVLLASTLLTAAYVVEHTAADNSVETISSFTLSNNSASPVTVTIAMTPAAAAPVAADEIATITVPPAGAAPTIVSGLVGQHLLAGQSLQMKASTAGTIAARVSGYRTTP
jgi:hypothetical protein